MKKLITTIGLMVAVLAMSFTFMGCQSSPQTTAAKAEGVVIKTVDTGMKAFSDAANSGQVTQAQLDAVKKFYGDYFDAQQIAKAALEKWIASKSPGDKVASDAAQAAVINAESALLDLINKFLTPAKGK